ncbi:hypothetical protein SAMN05428946_0072 [Edaphobacillus lindanitolerans]|uniref:Uncharacterized protein n=1 Tax=Edaphobacillus lindanitolerans TaxID=550447 RepID=A0A1U7PHC5_9BACI|nr:hypothetical protein SAMN05428946_0072 [Edaphobacillus lindanitolerans]
MEKMGDAVPDTREGTLQAFHVSPRKQPFRFAIGTVQCQSKMDGA